MLLFPQSRKETSIYFKMESREVNEPTVKVLTVQPCEVTTEENINYIAINFQDWDAYICSWSEFESFLKDREGNIVKIIAGDFANHCYKVKDTARLSEQRRPMAEKLKNCTEIEINKLANHRLVELLRVIEMNQMERKMSNRLKLEEPESVDKEDEHKDPQRLTRNTSESYTAYSTKISGNWIKFWSEAQIHESLLTRRRGQHLSGDQSRHIIQLLERSPESKGCLQKMFKLSQSTIKRIMRQISITNLYWNHPTSQTRGQKTISDEAKQLIKSYLCPPWGPKCISMVRDHIETELGESHSQHKIRSFVKREMKFVYKKGSPRPPIYATKRSQLTEALFWVELLLLVSKGEVIINCDESSFDRSVKRQFSWLPAGKSCPIINDKLKGRASLILATWNTGEWVAMVVLDTINSDKFWFFLTLLDTVINWSNDNKKKSPIVIFDNARTHTSIKTKSKIKELDMQVRFMAPYWPEVAPIERVFGKIKSKLRVLGGTLDIDFSLRKGVEIIFSLLKSLEVQSWMKAWVEVIKESRFTIAGVLIRNALNDRSHKSNTLI